MTTKRPLIFDGGKLKELPPGVGVRGACLISDVPPLDPSATDFWWDSSVGVLKIRYDDGDSIQWVDATPIPLKPSSIRNRWVNPALQISQENGDSSSTADSFYIADQFFIRRNTSAGTITAKRVQSRTPGGAVDRAQVTITAADTSLAAGEFLFLRSVIEGGNVADAKWGTTEARQILLRFLFKGPLGTYAVSVCNDASDRSYVAEFSPAAANTDEIIELIIPGDVSGTWLTDTGKGMQIAITLACGTTYQGITGWQSGNILGTSAVSNGMAVSSAVFEFGEFGLYIDQDEMGVFPKWEVPDSNDEFLRCARYYLKCSNNVVGFNDTQANASGDSRTKYVHYFFPTLMRTPPSVSVNSSFTLTGTWVNAIKAHRAAAASAFIECTGFTANARL